MNNEQDHALLPCPFCGCANIHVTPDEVGSGGQWVGPVHVVCGGDCVAGQSGDDRESAIAAWNRRDALQSQDQEDAERIQFMADEACTFNTWKQEDGSWKYRLEWDHGTEWQTEWFSTPEEAIDHARSV